MAFPSIVTYSTGSGYADTTFSVTTPGGSAASGDLIIVFCAFDGSTLGSDAYDFNLLVAGGDGSQISHTIGYRICTGSEGSTLSWGTQGSSDNYAYVAYKISASSWYGTAAGLEVNTIATSSGTQADPTSITASWGSDDNLFFACCSMDDGRDTISSGPSGWSNFHAANAVGVSGCNSGAASLASASASADPGYFTLSASEQWCAYTVVVRPVGSTATQIKITDSTHAHSADAPAISQNHQVKVADSTSAHEADAPAIAQSHQIAVADATSVHEAGQPDISVSVSIKIADSTHAHGADAPGLSQLHQIAVTDSEHAHSAAAPAISQSYQIAVTDSEHAHSADAPGISEGATGVSIAIADATHAQSAGTPFADSFAYWYQTDGQTYCVGLN